MIDIKEEDKERQFKLLVLGISHQQFIRSTQELLDFKQQILQDHELRKKIVDLADIWDGVESARYGKQLDVILNDLGIKDIPEFYSKENMDKFIKELDQDRRRKK